MSQDRWSGSLSLQVAADHAETGRSGHRARSLVYEDAAVVSYGRGSSSSATTDRQRFNALVIRGDDPNECWVLPSGKEFFVAAKGRSISARRFAWEIAHKREAPPRLEVTCKTTSCCNPRHAIPVRSERERFLSYVPKHKPNACAIWTGTYVFHGAKSAKAGKKPEPRFSLSKAEALAAGRRTTCVTIGPYLWEMHHGPVPKGHLVFRTCFNGACCNIRHLWTGTAKDRVRYLRDSGAHDSMRRKLTGNGPAQRKAKVIEARIRADLTELRSVRLKSYNALLRELCKHRCARKASR